MKYLKKVSYVLLVIGGLNWGIIGLFQTDIVSKLLGDMSMASRLVYVLVGISAVVTIITKCGCKGCNGSNCCQ
ncbi:MAG: hypothetical protein RLY43_2552 [Bacteroidota bacterium]